MDIRVERIDFDHEFPERATVDFVVGSTQFRWWRVNPGHSRLYVNPPSRRLNDGSYVDTVVFPTHVSAAVEAAVLQAYEIAIAQQGVPVPVGEYPTDDSRF